MSNLRRMDGYWVDSVFTAVYVFMMAVVLIRGLYLLYLWAVA